MSGTDIDTGVVIATGGYSDIEIDLTIDHDLEAYTSHGLLMPTFSMDDMDIVLEDVKIPVRSGTTIPVASEHAMNSTEHAMNSTDRDGDDEYQEEDQPRQHATVSATPNRALKREDSSMPCDSASLRRIAAINAAAIRKPVLVDWDSDDEIIWQMKSQGYKDEPVRERLIQEDRTRYDSKTISTRYSRMKKIMAEHEERTLDEGFSDYHEDEDQMIHSAVAEAEEEYQRELAKVDKKRWETVAETMKREMGRTKYTRNTAKERYTSLQDGTAIVPIEQDSNAEKRTAIRLHDRLKRQAASQAKREAARFERETQRLARIGEAERRETERREAGLERQRRSLNNARKKAAAKARAEARLKIKQENDDEKANKAAAQALEREQKRKAKEDDAVARKWKKDQERINRKKADRQAELDKIQAEVDKKRQAIQELNGHQERRELIHRFFRNAGIQTVAPVAERAAKRER